MSTMPHNEGHYWAKQFESECKCPDCEPSEQWEVVQVFDNSMADGPDFRVFIPGRAKSEPIANFHWGPNVLKPKGLV